MQSYRRRGITFLLHFIALYPAVSSEQITQTYVFFYLHYEEQTCICVTRTSFSTTDDLILLLVQFNFNFQALHIFRFTYSNRKEMFLWILFENCIAIDSIFTEISKIIFTHDFFSQIYLHQVQMIVKYKSVFIYGNTNRSLLVFNIYSKTKLNHQLVWQ